MSVAARAAQRHESSQLTRPRTTPMRGHGCSAARPFVLACALAVSLSAACTRAWHPVPPDQLQAGLPPRTYERVLLVTRGGYEGELTQVTLGPDSLVGMRTDSVGQRLAVSLAEVVRMENREREPAPAVKAVGSFVVEAGAGFYKMIGALLKCLVLKC